MLEQVTENLTLLFYFLLYYSQSATFSAVYFFPSSSPNSFLTFSILSNAIIRRALRSSSLFLYTYLILFLIFYISLLIYFSSQSILSILTLSADYMSCFSLNISAMVASHTFLRSSISTSLHCIFSSMSSWGVTLSYYGLLVVPILSILSILVARLSKMNFISCWDREWPSLQQQIASCRKDPPRGIYFCILLYYISLIHYQHSNLITSHIYSIIQYQIISRDLLIHSLINKIIRQKQDNSIMENLIAKLAEKQSEASHELAAGLENIDMIDQLNDNNDANNINDAQQNTTAAERKLCIVDSIKVKKDQVFEHALTDGNLVASPNSRGTPIHGFKLTEQSQQQEQYGMPTPKLTVDPPSSINNASGEFRKKIHSIKQKQSSFQGVSVVTNHDGVGQQDCQLPAAKNKQHSLMSVPMKSVLKPLMHKQKNYVNLRVRKTVKTCLTLPDNNQWQSSTMLDNVTYTSCKNRSKNPNSQKFMIESNVVSYCQSLNHSKLHQEPNCEQSKDQNQDNKRSQMKVKKNSQCHRKSKIKVKTEGNYPNLQEMYRSEEAVRTQLKVVYQKKNRLQKKLKQLDKQLRKISHQQSSRISINLSINEQFASKRGQILKNRKQFSLNPLIGRNSSQSHEQQIERSKKAIEFVAKMSKESLKRRLENQNKQKRLREVQYG